jgi:spermidine synthase
MADRAVIAGGYTKLTCDGAIVMSDTPAEMADHFQFYRKAKGHVLIAGLGLGMVANAVANKPDVKSVTILEISEDVIKLVGHTLHKKCTVVHADVMEYKPTRKYDYMWIDIWNDICKENLDMYE